MLFLPEFPWSDLHTLNLDWLLSVVANHERQLQNIEGAASPYDEAPLADGVAEPGTVNQFARGDHRHPTDTTRASVAALQAVQDSVPGPSNGNPRMDGAANPGTYTYYSRADHVHPSDTSKLDKTGGAVNGLLDILPRRCYASLSSAGWYRALKIRGGSWSHAIDLCVTRNNNTSDNEVHSIKMLKTYNAAPVFVSEESKTNALLVEAIRYTQDSSGNGYVDVRYDANSANDVSVDFQVHTAPTQQGYFTAEQLQAVAASPSGETVVTTYEFSRNGIRTVTLTSAHSSVTINAQKAVRSGKVVSLWVDFTVSSPISGYDFLINAPTFATAANALVYDSNSTVQTNVRLYADEGDNGLRCYIAIPAGRYTAFITYITSHV